jgi:predicted RNA binding protein with dsRBD fold (UPF0201 family)
MANEDRVKDVFKDREIFLTGGELINLSVQRKKEITISIIINRQIIQHGILLLIFEGTGFMGKIFVERLLRQTEIKKIYLLVRQKRGKDVKERLDDYLNDAVRNL